MATTFGLRAFDYPEQPHRRRHGPCDYEDYKSYKPWLRDEFAFRCVYCLVRERWYPDGSAAFGVDHFVPKSIRPDLICDYENLLYLCNRCNAAKRVKSVLDPCAHALSNHLRVDVDGTVVALTPEGQDVIDSFNLNYVTSTGYRRRKIELLTECNAANRHRIVFDELTYPNDIPRLDVKRCRNLRPEGIKESFFERRIRGDLERMY